MWNKIMNWFEAYGRYRAAKVVVENLSRLSDRELKDMGISRGEIATYAYTGRKSSNL